MYEKYNPTFRMSFEESYAILKENGVFSDFGYDMEYEREALAIKFMDLITNNN